jgi:putative hydrolase of the HAD superfamily
LLDAMGTLIGLKDSVGTTYAALAQRHGLTVEPAAIDQVFPSIYGQAPPLAFPGLEGPALKGAEITWWGERINETLLQAGAGPAPEGLRMELFERFACTDLWRVFAEVPCQLEAWKARGLKLAVVSNFDQRLHDLLEGLGLNRWLDAVVISSQAGAAKPNPKPLLLALQALELGAHQVWHVGDSAADEQAAQAAGIHCVLVKRP